MSARGRKHPVDRVEDRVVGRPVLQQPRRRLLAAGHQVGLDAELDQRGRGLLADRRHLDPGEGARVQPVLLELLADRLDRVHGGEGDPLVPAGDQALDGALHLLRGARRLHGDGRHLGGHGAVGAKLVGEGGRLLLGARHQDLPAEQRLGLEPGQLLALRRGTALADHGYDGLPAVRRRQHLGLLEGLGDPAERRGERPLPGGRARQREGQRGVRLAAGRHQFTRGRGDLVQGRGDDDGRIAHPQLGPAPVVGGARVHEPHVGALRVPQRDPGVGGHPHGRRDTRDDLEGNPLGRQHEHLAGRVRVQPRITRDRTHDPLAGARGGYGRLARVESCIVGRRSGS